MKKVTHSHSQSSYAFLVTVTTESTPAFVIFKPDGYNERGFNNTKVLSLCNWQHWVITASTTGKLHKKEKTQ